MPTTLLRPALVAIAVAAIAAPAQAAPRQASPPASAPADEPMLAYTVAPHDTLIGLNRTLFASPKAWPEVARINRLPDPNRITPGQVLRVPTRLLHSKAVPATLASVFGDVRIAGRPAQAGAALQVGQALATGDASSAVVQLADGSRITLAPDSEGRLDEHRRFQVKATKAAIDEGLVAGTLRLVRGSIEVFATKVLRARPLEVNTPTAVIGVRGTVYRVRSEPARGTAADTSATEVLEGKVHAQVGDSPAQAVDVPAGFGAELEAGKAPVALPLLAAPSLDSVPAVVDHLPLRFRVEGGTPVRVQLAADAAFERIAADLHVDAGDEVKVPGLADGPWHLRVRRIGPEGLEGLDAVRALEVRARPEPPYLVEPPGGAKRMVGDVALRWTENPEAASYLVEVARDAAFTQMAWRAADVHGTTAVFRPAGSAFGATDGVYFWRVESVRPDGRSGPLGETQAFVLRPVPRAPLGGLSPDGSVVELRWGGNPDDRVRAELARDADFREIVERGEFRGPGGRFARPASGTYYARYRFLEPDGFETSWSAAVQVQVDSNWHKAIRALLGGAPQ